MYTILKHLCNIDRIANIKKKERPVNENNGNSLLQLKPKRRNEF